MSRRDSLSKRASFSIALWIQGVFTAIQAAALLVIAFVPVEHWKDRGFYGGLMLSFHAPAIAQALDETTPEDIPIATDGYTEESLLEIYSNRAIQHHRRRRALRTRRRSADGLSAVGRKRRRDLYAPRAQSSRSMPATLTSIERDDWNGWECLLLFHGHGFKYSAYRDRCSPDPRGELQSAVLASKASVPGLGSLLPELNGAPRAFP